MNAIKEAALTHINKVVIGAAVLLLLAGALSVVTTLSRGGNNAAAESQAAVTIEQLTKDRAAAEVTLNKRYDELLTELPGIDYSRVTRDTNATRSLVLTLTDAATSTRPLQQAQYMVDSRYEALNPTSSTLTEFLPQWRAVLNPTSAGSTYRLSDLGVDVIQIQGLTYSYVALARFEPVTADEQTIGKPEFMLVTLTTAADGSITAISAYRVSSESRDQIIIAEKATSSTATPSPTPTASSSSSSTPTPSSTPTR